MAENDPNEQKQSFLRTAILDAGYSGDKFIAYLESLRSTAVILIYDRSQRIQPRQLDFRGA